MEHLLKKTPPNKELLICGFSITHPKALAKIKKLWSKQKKEIRGEKILGRSKEDTLAVKSSEMGGTIVLLDPENINNPHLGEIKVKTPMGLYYSKYHRMLFTGSDHWVHAISKGEIVKTLNNQYFNCIHGLAGSLDGKLWVVSTGIDAVIKIDINCPEKTLASWFATEHGYNISANGNTRFIDKTINHQGIDDYSTPEHTTHINSVLEYKKDKLLAVLFHQGELVEIDINTGRTKKILTGLKQPHNIRPVSFGYILSDTNGKRIIKLGKSLKNIGEIKGNFNWIQDAIELGNKNIVVADANNGKIVIINPEGKVINEWIFGKDKKRIGVLLTVKTSEALNIFIK